MARTQKNKQLRPLHLFICEDSKSSKYYMQGLGRAKGINIKAEEADGTSPANVLRSAKEKQKLFKDKGTVQIYCLFDKDDCDDEKFKKAIQQCRKAGFVDAVSVPCYEYWLLLHLKKTNQPFRDAKECCETFQSEYNRKFQTQYTVMLKDDFIRKDTEEYTFNEQEAINDIKRYLSLAEGINVKLNEFKSSIYQKKIEVDNLKVETLELTKIIENTRHSYNEIRDVCAHCGSDLTEQQSMMRIRLENDQYEATLLRNDLDRKIKKLEAEIDSILQGKLGFENEYASLLSIAEKKQGEITLQQFIEQKAQKLAKTNYVEVKNTLNEKIADLTERINKLSSEIRILEKQQRVQRDTIGLRFNELKEKLKITFSTASLNELSFLEFKTITASGTVSNVTLFSIYIIYLRLLSEYSVVELPFGFDALIKDELTENNIKLMYETLEKYILNSNKQVFVVMLKDKLKYITGKHNLIELNKPILDKTKYDELLGEFTYMRKL